MDRSFDILKNENKNWQLNFKSQRNRVIATNSDFLIPLSFVPYVVDLR